MQEVVEFLMASLMNFTISVNRLSILRQEKQEKVLGGQKRKGE